MSYHDPNEDEFPVIAVCIVVGVILGLALIWFMQTFKGALV